MYPQPFGVHWGTNLFPVRRLLNRKRDVGMRSGSVWASYEAQKKRGPGPSLLHEGGDKSHRHSARVQGISASLVPRRLGLNFIT